MKITGPLTFKLTDLNSNAATFQYTDNSKEAIGNMRLSLEKRLWDVTKPTELTITVEGWFK